MLCLKSVLNLSVVRIGVARYGSALFVPGDKATDVCVVVNPHVEHTADLEAVRRSVEMRGGGGTNVVALGDIWKFYEEVRGAKEAVERKIKDQSNKMKELYTRGDENSKEEIYKCKLQQGVLKEELRTLRSSFWAAEEKAVVGMLSLPNHIHPLTHETDPTVIYEYKEKNRVEKPVSHLELGVRDGLLRFYTSQSYYLMKEAALAELGSKYYFADRLRAAGFVQFSNADFVKSVVIDGCGMNHMDPTETYILHHNENTQVNDDLRLHLVGGGSLSSFAAYHTRNIIPHSYLPLRYFALGRQYSPSSDSSHLGLFDVAQSSVVEMFTMLEDSDESINQELTKIIEILKDVYQGIGQHFRVCYIAARSLQKWESLRVSFQMFSPHLDDYIEVGNVSVSDDFISKRLQIQYRHDKESRFTRIVSGTLLSVPRLLGCLMEAGDSFQIPPAFTQYINKN